MFKISRSTYLTLEKAKRKGKQSLISLTTINTADLGVWLKKNNNCISFRMGVSLCVKKISRVAIL